CTGSGGPTPVFEKHINAQRRSTGKDSLRFYISDKYPNPEAWKEIVAGRYHLNQIEESVDAADPPPNRIFRLFNLSFHHFPDPAAIEILRSTMETADGIAIIELQDRRLGCLAMMGFNWMFLWKITPFWSEPKRSLIRKMLWLFPNMVIYAAVLFTLCWDGMASCIRTREFGEFIDLVAKAADGSGFVLLTQRHSIP
ncbi:hypothetical protein CC80DRAFT_398533, partial [Byssothecium circinans]